MKYDTPASPHWNSQRDESVSYGDRRERAALLQYAYLQFLCMPPHWVLPLSASQKQIFQARCAAKCLWGGHILWWTRPKMKWVSLKRIKGIHEYACFAHSFLHALLWCELLQKNHWFTGATFLNVKFAYLDIFNELFQLNANTINQRIFKKK